MLESHHTKLALRGHQKQMSPNKYIQRKTTDQIPDSTQTQRMSLNYMEMDCEMI